MKGTKPHIRVERDPIGEMPPPDHLSKDAREEWARVMPILAERKIISSADIGCLEAYCMSIGQVREMNREIQRLGAVQMVYAIDKEGNSRVVKAQKNPAVQIQSAAMTQARLLASELGLTPVSRSRPSVAGDDDSDDLFNWGA